jgi:hypothetical protein
MPRFLLRRGCQGAPFLWFLCTLHLWLLCTWQSKLEHWGSRRSLARRRRGMTAGPIVKRRQPILFGMHINMDL